MEYGFASENHRIFPPMVVVSITNVCNLRCIHCHYRIYARRPEYKAHMLDWDIWQAICDQMGDYPWSILNLGTDGEPLLHPRFLDMMRYARQKGLAPINLTTNGLLLEGKLADAILDEEVVDVVNVSLDALSEEKYRLIRGGSHARVYGNVENFLAERNRRASRVKVQVNIIDQPEVHDELPAFVAHWQGRVDNVLVRTYYDATHVTGQPGPDLTGKQGPFAAVTRWPCQQFWRRFNVADDGTARFCVDDWYNRTQIGDLHRETIAQLWQSPAYEELRQRHLAGDFAAIPFCASCTEWQGMKWDFDYFTALEKMLGRAVL
jgi:uncharacterized Fe-S cluster-containing radical SAM superfamily enzyme